MTTIRVIFDGKNFVPQDPVSLPAQSEAIVLLDETASLDRRDLDAAIREYYQSSDQEDDAFPPDPRAWDEE